jgi:hypothetical protein
VFRVKRPTRWMPVASMAPGAVRSVSAITGVRMFRTSLRRASIRDLGAGFPVREPHAPDTAGDRCLLSVSDRPQSRAGRLVAFWASGVCSYLLGHSGLPGCQIAGGGGGVCGGTVSDRLAAGHHLPQCSIGGCFPALVYGRVPVGGRDQERRLRMRRWQPGCHPSGGHAACQPRAREVPRRVCPGRCGGPLAGRYPGSLDVPADLPSRPEAYPLASGEMYLARRTGTDD